MAQIRILKIASDGVPVEHADADDLSLNSFTVQGGGPELSSTGLDMNNTDVSDVQDLAFTAPSTATINQTAGNVVVDDLMAKERSNIMTTAGDVLFPVISDAVGEVDAFRLPALAGAPSATPTAGGEGYLVWDSTNDKLYAWNGSGWDDLSTVDSANAIDDSYVADEALVAVDAVYLSAADNVSKASASASGTSHVIGFATESVSDTDSVNVRKFGVLAGFTSLTAGARYFLGTTAGAVVSTPPTGSGNTVIQVGYAKNTTSMDIQIQSLGRRA